MEDHRWAITAHLIPDALVCDRSALADPTAFGAPGDLGPPAGDRGDVLPFFEAYFSNFIEGTEFAVDEAERIVRLEEVPAERPEDAHDVLGSWHDRAAVGGKLEATSALLDSTDAERAGRRLELP